MASDTIVKNGPVFVMYAAGLKGAPIAEQAPIAFRQLEAGLSSLKGRKFYGVIIGDEYRACVAIDQNSYVSSLPFPTWTIPGGRYIRRKIPDWEINIHLIGPSFDDLFGKPYFDSSRPLIEFYRSQKEILLMVPVL